MSKHSDESIFLYSQLGDELINYIHENLKPGEQLPSEREICEQYSVSRTTVRQALTELENSGYIYKRHGKGTFVSPLYLEKKPEPINYGFVDQIRRSGKVPETQILSFKKILAPPTLTEILSLTSQELYKVERLHLGDKKPLIFETVYVPAILFPNLSVPLLESARFYDLVAHVYKYHIAYADQEFSASTLTLEEASALSATPAAPCLRMTRLTHLDDNRSIEYALAVGKPDAFLYKTRNFFAR